MEQLHLGQLSTYWLPFQAEAAIAAGADDVVEIELAVVFAMLILIAIALDRTPISGYN